MEPAAVKNTKGPADWSRDIFSQKPQGRQKPVQTPGHSSRIPDKPLFRKSLHATAPSNADADADADVGLDPLYFGTSIFCNMGWDGMESSCTDNPSPFLAA